MNDVAAPAAQSWKVTLPCTRAEAEALDGDIAAFALMEHPPVLMTSEAEPDDENKWQLDAYFEGKPSPAAIKLLKTLVPSASGIKPQVEALPDEDWVTMSQQGLEPVTAGRFHVRNVASDPEQPGHVNFLIEASRAFGTGQHETTAGCLAMIDRMRSVGMRFRNVADIGTGTGLLAFAALSLWPRALATASDIDAVCADVVEANARANGIRMGSGNGQLVMTIADGMAHPLLAARGPYDLIMANILAGPLVALAPDFGAALVPGGHLVLAGLLQTQEAAVRAACRKAGLRLAARLTNGDWSVLWLRRRRR